VGQLAFAAVPAWGFGSHAFFVRYDASSDRWIKLDVVTELAFGPNYSLATRAEAECLARRRRLGAIAVLTDDDAFWSLLLHRLFDKGGVGSRDAGRLLLLARTARTDSTLARLVDSLCPPGWSAAGVVAAARGGEWDRLASLRADFIASWQRRRRTDVSRRTVANTYRRWSGKVIRLVRRRGLRVAILAPDGAGKSTLTKGLEGSFYFPVRSISMGLYQAPRARRSRRVRGLGLAAELSAQWARWAKGAYHERRGRLVLFDRYAYDALLPLRFQHRRVARVRRWLLGHACPPPDLVVLLDAPGEVLFERKGEKSVALLEAQRRAYRALLARRRRAVVVDASRDVEQVRSEVTAVIWREYVRRWNGQRVAPE
jgi:thymidylate kinase